VQFTDLLLGDQALLDTDVIDGTLEIAGLTCDSRRVRPGFLFAALPGVRVDGRDYIGAAVQNGAVAVLAPPGTKLPTDAPVALIEDANVRQRFSQLAAHFYARQPDRVVAVTGTNGKTSVASFARQIWQQLGFKAATIGTLGVQGDGFEIVGTLTTPDPVLLHQNLADLAAAGVDRVAIEASSHGLVQFRLDGVRVRAAGFTNISREHLDYHDTMARYLNAKMRLFSEIVDAHGTAVINADSPEGQEIAAVARKRGLTVMSYGRGGRDLQILDLVADRDGQTVTLKVAGVTSTVTVPLVGTFQIENALCALGLVIAEGADAVLATAALAHLQGVPGRMQRVGGHRGASAFVDYAHTPDGLKNMLQAMRPYTQNTLHVVFGCGGDRDAGKRVQMGAVAARYADRVTITDDNPRTEDPAAIRAGILAGCPEADEIGDRHRAILKAVESMQNGDVVVVTGKGHEQGQIVADQVLPFDDIEEIKSALDAQQREGDA